MAPFNLVTRTVLLLVLALVCQGARADTAIRLLKSFAGNVNFAGTQQTIRNKGNNKPCEMFDPSVDRTATLSGIPASATILSAQLYWAGSNYNPDFTVIFDGVSVNSEDERSYYSTTIGNNFNYYSGAADVTEHVKKKWSDKKEDDKKGKGNNGNGKKEKGDDYDKYSFRGLTVDTNSPYCSVEGVLGGFALLVVYSDTSEPFRMLNLYEGFQYMRYSGISLNLSGFKVPNPIGTATGRVAHITWEGDATLDGSGENLKFNGYEMTDPQNPSGNQFNSRSNIDGDDKSYGIDFDAYTIRDPVIKGGQTTATTRYESGQDLVLLSAEVVALPNVPMSDLSISMQLVGELVQGEEASYKITVTNGGPSAESGPIVVTSTLPVALTYVAAASDGWLCSNVGRDVTCTSAGPLAATKSLSVLTLTVRVTGTGTITNSALVTGTTYDPQTGNNAASVKSTVSDGSSAFAFTVGACRDGLPFGDPKQTCTKVLPEVKAGVSTPIFITAMAGGVPTAASVDASVQMRFALSCHNPVSNAGVKARYAGKQLELCEKDGEPPTAWSEKVDIKFMAKDPSSEAVFKYDDVGLVELFMLTGPEQTVGGRITFVSVPYEIRFMRDGVALPDKVADAENALVRAGQFGLEIGSYAFGTQATLTPNFGKESPTVKFGLPTMEKAAVEGSAAWVAMANFPEVEGVPGFSTLDKGRWSGKFSWPEVGLLKLTPVPTPAVYLGRPLTIKDAYVRFIPHHFTTTAQQMDCVPNMQCEVDTGISTAAYSKESIAVTVSAKASGGTNTQNYRGVFARKVVLSAWEDPSKGEIAKPGLSNVEVADTKFEHGDGTAQAAPVFTLLNAFDHTAPPVAWSAPTSIYLRATEASGSDGVTSKSDGYEVGVRIVSGRLLVPNAHGSERLNLPLKVSAQYWTGANWELSRTDNKNIIDPAKAVFSNSGNLSLSLVPNTALMLANGGANFGVKVAPVVAGKADVVINYLDWLPSTKGRLKFGTYKSPLIYLREIH